MEEILAWMESTALARLSYDYTWWFPAMETVHFLGLCLLLGSTMVLDMRVLGLARLIPARQIVAFVPIAIFGFSLNLLSGIAFLFSDPFRYWPNVFWRIKMILIVVAGLNAIWFTLAEQRKVLVLPDGVSAARPAKICAAVSFIVWVAIIVLGRLMPYVE